MPYNIIPLQHCHSPGWHELLTTVVDAFWFRVLGVAETGVTVRMGGRPAG